MAELVTRREGILHDDGCPTSGELYSISCWPVRGPLASSSPPFRSSSVGEDTRNPLLDADVLVDGVPFLQGCRAAQ
jgi:hypothetical protein